MQWLYFGEAILMGRDNNYLGFGGHLFEVDAMHLGRDNVDKQIMDKVINPPISV